MRKYIGTKQPDEKSKGNLHEIWYEYQPGWFICNTKPNYKLPVALIVKDFKNGYLKEYEGTEIKMT
jgi:hypothetical protein